MQDSLLSLAQAVEMENRMRVSNEELLLQPIADWMKRDTERHLCLTKAKGETVYVFLVETGVMGGWDNSKLEVSPVALLRYRGMGNNILAAMLAACISMKQAELAEVWTGALAQAVKA